MPVLWGLWGAHGGGVQRRQAPATPPTHPHTHHLNWHPSTTPATSPAAAGHVDNFCCFISPGVVALAWPNDENDFNDPQYEISMDAYERLSNTTGKRR